MNTSWIRSLLEQWPKSGMTPPFLWFFGATPIVAKYRRVTADSNPETERRMRQTTAYELTEEV